MEFCLHHKNATMMMHSMASHRPIDNAARLSHILSVFQTSADVAASYHVHFCRLPMLIVHFNQLFVRTVDVIYNFNCD